MKATVNKRRSLTPYPGVPGVPGMPGGQPAAQARRSGVRRTVSDRVTFRTEAGGEREGWALNVSSGGIRAILDHDTGKVELGEEYLILVGAGASAAGPDADGGSGSASESMRRGRIVWLQEEPDGFVVGVEFLSPSGLSGMHTVAGADEGASPDASGAAARADVPRAADDANEANEANED